MFVLPIATFNLLSWAPDIFAQIGVCFEINRRWSRARITQCGTFGVDDGKARRYEDKLGRIVAIPCQGDAAVSSVCEQEIYAALTEIFRDVFANQTLRLNAGMSAQDIQGWDSFAHVNIIVAAEARFGVRFRSSEVRHLTSVGDLVRVIQLKRS